MDARRWRWLIDLAAWAAIWWFGVFVGTWWAHQGPELMARLAAWSERRPEPGSVKPTAEQIKATQEVWRRRKASD